MSQPHERTMRRVVLATLACVMLATVLITAASTSSGLLESPLPWESAGPHSPDGSGAGSSTNPPARQGEVLGTGRAEVPARPELTSARKIELRTGESKRITMHVGDLDRSICGRVLNGHGAAVPAVAVVARRHLGRAEENTIVPKSQGGQCAVTDADGSFEVAHLETGDYEVRTLPTDRYAPSRKIVRAGAQSVHLTLREIQALWVHGRIRSAHGAPLGGVVVSSLGRATRQTGSTSDGSYRLELALDGRSRFFTSRFDLPGYRTVNWRLPADRLQTMGEHRLDVQMEPIGVMTRVTGRVRSADGAAVAGEKLVLSSRRRAAQHQAVSRSDGSFHFPRVEAGEDYRLSIRPSGDYEDVTRTALVVPENGLRLELVMDPLESGRIRGFMVDPLGRPVPGFGLWVRSAIARGRPVGVAGDSAGCFDVDKVPAGELTFETRSAPRFTFRGVRLSRHADQDLRLVLDVGEAVVTGVVTNLEGRPLGGAEVALSWTHRGGRIESRSHRHAVADQTGRFVFTSVGPGLHELRVSSPGYESAHLRWDVGRHTPETVLVRLVPGG